MAEHREVSPSHAYSLRGFYQGNSEFYNRRGCMILTGIPWGLGDEKRFGVVRMFPALVDRGMCSGHLEVL